MKPTIFRDEKSLLQEYQPHFFPHRQPQFKQLTNLFTFFITAPYSGSLNVLISGPSGSGKTAVVKSFGSTLQEVARGDYGPTQVYLKYIHIDCNIFDTPASIANHIIQDFIPNFAPPNPEGSNPCDSLQILFQEILEKRNAFLLLTLDHAETFILREPAFIRMLARTEIAENSISAPKKSRISLIFIVQSDQFKTQLDPCFHELFKYQLRFERYTRTELQDILKERSRIAFSEGKVLDTALELIRDFAEEGGDARYALRLLWCAGKCADEVTSNQITPDLCRSAKEKINGIIQSEVILSLTLHQKLILLGIARNLKQTQKIYITFNDCRNYYNMICEENIINPLSTNRMSVEIIKLTRFSGILSVKLINYLYEWFDSDYKSEYKIGQAPLIRLNLSIERFEALFEKEIKNKKMTSECNYTR